MSTTQRRTIAVVCLLVILLAGAAVNVRFWKTDTREQDIYYSWVEGGRILNGENPYAACWPATCKRMTNMPPISRSFTSFRP